MVFPAVFCSQLFSIPLVLSYHTHLPKYVESYVPARLSRLCSTMVWWLLYIVHGGFADMTLVTSEPIQQEFIHHKIPRVTIWQKGIDTQRFHPRYANMDMRRRMTNGHMDDLCLLYVGRLASEKRVMDLLEMMHHLPSSVRLCLVGTGPQEEELHLRWSSMDDALKSRIVFLGELRGDVLSQAYASADLFVFPSDSETLGFVVLEAMASGLVVIGANAGGIPTLIEHNTTGLLVTPGNTTDYVRHIQQLHRDEPYRTQLATQARQATEQWSWDASMAKLWKEQYPQAQDNYYSRRQRRWRFWLPRWLATTK